MRQRAMLVAVLLALAGSVALAQPDGAPPAGGGYELTWSSVDGGAGLSSGGGFSLAGTSGQPDAGQLAGGDYTLGGGFWGGGETAPEAYESYLPLVMR